MQEWLLLKRHIKVLKSSNHIGTNSDLNDVMEKTDDNASVHDPTLSKEDQNTKLRLKIKKLQSKMTNLTEKIEEQSEIISKHKSKAFEEVEYSAKLRKDLLKYALLPYP